MQHLEFTPDDLDIFENELVYACYELCDEKRIGKIATESKALYRGDGVLDIEIHGQKLYGVTSNGSLLRIDGDKGNQITSTFLEDGINLTISINSTGRGCITTNNGSIFIVDLDEDIILNSFKGHSFEVWSCCWYNEKSVLTGADDSVLKFWDLNDTASPSWSKRMEMGVSCIARAGDKGILIGNYDEKLRLIDPRMPSIFVQELDCGGGIWRIKENPEDPNIWLVAAMHGGAKIVDIQKNEVIQSFDEHDSMVYGAVWLNKKEIATCSFYDKKLCFWRFGGPNK